MSSIPEPGIQSCNTGQRMPFFDSCQLITTWMSITKIYTDSIKVCHFASANMKGWTYVRTYSVRRIFSEPKFLGCVDYHIFLPRCARESSAITLQSIFKSHYTRLRACLHGVGDPGIVGLVSFVFTLWGTQNNRNLPH